MEDTIHVELLAHRPNVYSLYVFKELGTNKLIMCTKLPDWEMPNIEVGEVGFVKLQNVTAGDEYYDVANDSTKKYRFTNVYLLNYVKETDITNTNINL